MNVDNVSKREIAKNALQALYADFMAYLSQCRQSTVDFDNEINILCDLLKQRVADLREISFCLHIGGSRFNEKQFAAVDFPRAHFEHCAQSNIDYGNAKNPAYLTQFDKAALWRAQKFLTAAYKQWAAAKAGQNSTGENYERQNQRFF